MDDTIFITNIKSSVDEKTLSGFFSRCGNIVNLSLAPDNFSESSKICYIKFSSPEEATQAIKQGDKSTYFGDPLRISLKKPIVINKGNGINTPHSYGRGRGINHLSPVAPKFSDEIVQLKDITLPLEKKLQVEIIELKSLSNIFVRPLQMTEKSLTDLYSSLIKVNNKVDILDNVQNPKINGFYLAKWNVDDKFYRAKILKKLSDDKFEVCFVDEGTSGDIVTELKIIPDFLSDIPCQFVACTINCKESPELVDLVLKEGSNSEVNIYVTNNAQVNGKCLVNIFIDGKDVIDLYKSTNKIDLRNEKIPCKDDIKRHKLEQPFSNCQVIKSPNESNYMTVVLNEHIAMTPKLVPLTSSPITNDLLVYKDGNSNLHRCIVQSYKFDRDHLYYWVYLVDENRFMEADFDNLWRAQVSDVSFPALVLRGVAEDEYVCPSLLEDPQTVTLSDYDAKKDLYVFKFEEKFKEVKMNPVTIGLIKTVLMSHVESGAEFYVQFKEDLSKLEMIQNEINDRSFVADRIRNIDELHINDAVIGPFDSVKYRASVRQIDVNNDAAMLFFVDYGNSEWVRVCEIMKSTTTVTKQSWMSHRCRLSVGCRQGTESEVTHALMEYCETNNGEVHMKINDILDDDGGRLMMVSLTASDKSTFADVLVNKSLTGNVNNTLDVVKETLVKKIANLEKRICQMERLVFMS